MNLLSAKPMKQIICIACLLVLSLLAVHPAGKNYHPRVAFTNSLAGSGGGACTPATGNETNESWEGSDSLTWIDTGTVDRNAALSGTSPCSGLGSQCAEINWDGSATRPYTSWNRGSLLNSTLYIRFYFNIVSHSMANGDDASIYASGEDTNPGLGNMFYVKIHDNAGQLTIAATTAASGTTPINISSATWYRAEFKYVVNSVGGSEFKLYDSAGSQVGSTQTWDTGNNWWQYTHFGRPTALDAKAFRVQIDGWGVDHTGYLGQ